MARRWHSLRPISFRLIQLDLMPLGGKEGKILNSRSWKRRRRSTVYLLLIYVAVNEAFHMHSRQEIPNVLLQSFDCDHCGVFQIQTYIPLGNLIQKRKENLRATASINSCLVHACSVRSKAKKYTACWYGCSALKFFSARSNCSLMISNRFSSNSKWNIWSKILASNTCCLSLYPLMDN